MDILYKIFIQNEAGAKIKNRHNEKTLVLLGSIELDEAYPFPYGFVIGTTTEDGDNVDCFVFTQEELRSNTMVEGRAIGLLELFEDGEKDHKVIAILPWEDFNAIEVGLEKIRRFYETLSDNFKMGAFLPVSAALEYIQTSSDSGPD